MTVARLALCSPLVLLGACKTELGSEAPDSPDPEATTETETAVRLRGHVHAHDGSALAGAHIELRANNMKTSVFMADLEHDGAVEIELPGPGVYSLRLAGVDHAESWTTFMATGGTIELDARLGTYARELDDTKLKLRLRYVDTSGEAGGSVEVEAEALADAKDRFVLELDPPPNAKALHYQIVDASGRSYNGPGASRWIYDGGGDYWAEIDLGDREQLELDLTELMPKGLESAVALTGEGLIRSRDDEAQAVLEGHRERLYALPRSTDAETDACLELRPLAAEAQATIEALDDPELRAFAVPVWGQLFGQLADNCLEPKDLVWMFEHAPADHVAWSFTGMGVTNIFYSALDDPIIQAFRRELAAAQADPGLRAVLLYLDLLEADHRDDDEAMTELWAALAGDYPDSYPKLWAQEHYDPNRPLQPGRPMPAWTFADLEGGQISSTDLAGQAYFLEVWATWCGPCVADMPDIHAAHEAMKAAPEPIAFVSVSFDASPEIVEQFRGGEWSMPWLHAHVPPGEDEKLREAWQFSGVPMPVLVDSEGIIIETGTDLRGEELIETLEARFLAGESS